MKFNWKTPLTALGGMGATVGMLALARTPLAANEGVVFAAGAVTSQFALALGFIGDRFDRWGKRRDASVGDETPAIESVDPDRSDLGDLEADTAPGSGEDDPTPLPEGLDKRLGEDLEKMVQANKRGDYAEVEALTESAGKSNALAKQTEDIDRILQAHKRGDRAEVAALLESVRQSAAELQRLEATPEPAGPGRENDFRGAVLPETARQDTPPESEQARASDDAKRATDDRVATPPRAGRASDTDERGAQTERDEASSRVRSPDDVQQPAEANEATEQPEDQRQPRGASAGEAEGVETEGQRPGADPSGPLGSEHAVAADERVEQGATSPDEGESQAPATGPSAERASHEAGSEPKAPSPEPVSEPSREPWVPTGRYPGSGVTAEQLRTMQGPAPKFAPPEAVTDAASRKQAALAAMTRDRTGVAEGSESTTEQGDQAQHPGPTTGADPGRPVRDRDME